MSLFRKGYLFLVFTLLILSSWAQPDSTDNPQIIDGGKVEFKTINVQWAGKVISFSSEFSSLEKSANQILGKPNVLPLGGKSVCAWAIKKKSSSGIETIRVAFTKPIQARQVAVAESFNPGAIEKITLFGPTKEDQKVVYESEAKAMVEVSRMLNVFFEPTPFEVFEAEIQINSKKITDFEIDAIGLSSTNDTIKAIINLPANVKYLAQKESLGQNINSIYDELAPVISADGKELFFVRKFHPDNFDGIRDEDDIWYSKYENKQWTLAKNVGSPLNNQFNNFVQSISPDGNTLLLANAYVKDGNSVTTRPGVSVSYKTKSGWSFPSEQRIKEFRNKSPFVNYFLSANGKYLIMAIEGEDSYGGLDLYVSFKEDENVWSKPINLGPDVNTTANDYSPYLAADGISLYYSTSGISGFGKEDIFISRRMDDSWKKWAEPMNMGQPINSSESDTKFSIPASGSYAYFSSLKGALGKNDIFRILLPDTVKPQPVALLKGKIVDFSSKTPIGGAVIVYKNAPDEVIVVSETTDSLTGSFSLYLPVGYLYTAIIKAEGYIDGKQSLDLTSIYNFTIIEQQPIMMVPKKIFKTIKGKLNDKLNDKDISNAKISIATDSLGKNIIAVSYTNEKGEYEFKLEDLENEQLFLVVEKENYQQEIFELSDNLQETEMNFDFDLTPEIKKDKVIEFHNIYFDFGSAEVKDQAKGVLDRIVGVMNENPLMEIELSGHTDSKSSDKFNMKLSQERADNARAYIISKGINEQRIIAVGYGESKLLNKCSDKVKCSEEEHALNRRIEVKVLKMQ